MNIWDLRWNSLDWMIKKRSHLMTKINVIWCYHCFQLCDLYENDSIFDKFECCLSGDGLRVATGSYGYFFHPLLITCVVLEKSCLLTLTFPGVFGCSNIFRVFGCTPGSMEATTLEASRNPMRYTLHVPFNCTHCFLTVVTMALVWCLP